LGPKIPNRWSIKFKKETGLAAAIVDANDLKAVKVLAATADVPPGFLEQALISNPAGNANEQTPVVLVRPLAVPNPRQELAANQAHNSRSKLCQEVGDSL
jgi:hypothetical protein